jgi:predicted outer membrane repeat protein
MSVGLFGAYTGNPRLQRAYASAPCAPAAVASSEALLNSFLDDSTVTCIEIEGLIQANGDLSVVDNSEWSNSNRETSGLTIFGDPSDGTDDTVDGRGLHRGFALVIGGSGAQTNHDVELNFSDVTLSNFWEDGSDSGGDGGVALNANVSNQLYDLRIQLSRVVVADNETYDNYGGAIYVNVMNRYSTAPSLLLDVADSTFSGNSGGNGGAFYAYSPDDSVVVSLESSTFTGNSATNWGGGAVFVKSMYGYTRLDVTGDSSFSGNASAHVGGAVYVRQGSAIDGATFQSNSAGAGGAIYTYLPDPHSSLAGLSISESTFSGNAATSGEGGAIATAVEVAGDGHTYLTNVSVIGNTATSNGGGVMVKSGVLHVENSFLGGNTSGGRGGAIHSQGLVSLDFSTAYDDSGAAGASEIWATDITSTMSVVGNSATGDIWEFIGTLDDTASVSTADDTVFAGAGSGNVAPGALALDSLTGTLPGQVGRIPGADSVLSLQAALSPLGFAPLTNPLPSITTDQLGVSRAAPFTIGARQVIGAPPAPTPSPAPATPAGPPREVTATPGVESAAVSWASPASSGSFPVTSYQVTASPGGRSCLVSAPALSCTVTGLTPGESYTFVAKALNGAGWGSPSAPSEAVVPTAPASKAILITSSRDRVSPSIVRVDGTTTGLVGAEVTPHVRKPGQTGFTPGSNVRTVDADGRFTWQRKSGKKLYVYFTSGDVRSNRLVIGSS